MDKIKRDLLSFSLKKEVLDNTFLDDFEHGRKIEHLRPTPLTEAVAELVECLGRSKTILINEHHPESVNQQIKEAYAEVERLLKEVPYGV